MALAACPLGFQAPHLCREARTQGSFLIALRGEIDLASQPDLEELVQGFRQSRDVDVEVDLAGVTYFDSTGLTFLMRLHSAAGRHGGRVTLVAPSRVCLRVLKLVSFDSIFTIRQVRLLSAP